MNARQMERAAYIAAHRLMTSDIGAPQLACPGGRRSAMLDNMAGIIKGVFEAHDARFDENTDWWAAQTGDPAELVRRQKNT
jgi:hypothetical protein